MPNVVFDRFVEVLLAHGFVFIRQKGSHRTYQGVVNGETKVVVVAGHRGNQSIKQGTLSSMIKQSGLNKKLFL